MGVILPASSTGLLVPGGPQAINPAHFAVPNGLVGYWGFDADCVQSSTLTADLSGNGNNGTITAAAPAAGQVGQSLQFNGSTSLISVPSSTKYDSTTGAWSAWINTTQSGSGLAVIMQRAPANSATGIVVLLNKSTGKVTQWGPGSLLTSLVSTSALNDGNWHFLTLVFDGTNPAILYTDGKRQASGSPGAWSFPALPVRFGLQTDGSWVPYAGSIDDPRIYNRALDPWEIITLYQAGLAGRRDAGVNLPEECEMDALRSSIVPVAMHQYMTQRAA